MEVLLNFLHTHVDNWQGVFHFFNLLLHSFDHLLACLYLLEKGRNLTGKEHIGLAKAILDVSQYLFLF